MYKSFWLTLFILITSFILDIQAYAKQGSTDTSFVDVRIQFDDKYVLPPVFTVGGNLTYTCGEFKGLAQSW